MVTEMKAIGNIAPFIFVPGIKSFVLIIQQKLGILGVETSGFLAFFLQSMRPAYCPILFLCVSLYQVAYALLLCLLKAFHTL